MAFKITSVKTRYFEFENPDDGRIIYIEPPKMKTMKDLEDMQKIRGVRVMDVAGLVSRLISKNKRGFKVSADKVLSWMDMDQMRGFMKAYMEWLNNEHSTDPN